METQIAIGQLIKQITDSLERQINNNVRDKDLTMAQTRVLIMLDQIESRTISMKELERSLGVAQSTCAGIVARLCTKGLVQTYSPPGDRRSKLVALTDIGRLNCMVSEQAARASEARMAKNFSPEEWEELHRLLNKLLLNLK